MFCRKIQSVETERRNSKELVILEIILIIAQHVMFYA